MALVLADRIRETTTTAGTGTITLAGAVTGYRSFATIGNGNTTYYTIAGQNTSEWEVGIGTYTSAGTTLSRTTVLASSNAGSLVTFSAGTKDVFVTYPAGKSIYQDANGGVSIAAPTSGNALSVTSVAGSYPLLTTSASTSSFNASFATSTGGTFGYIGCGTSLAAGAADADMGLYSASGKIFLVGSQGLTIKTGVAGATSTRMTLTNTGSFTINAPTSGVALLVNGTTTSGSNSNAFNVFTDSTNYATHVLRNTNAAGNASFSVQGGNAVLDVAVNANFGSLLGSIGTNTAHSFALNTSGTARLTINSTGNVTIAAPSSGTALSVQSDLAAIGAIQVTGTTAIQPVATIRAASGAAAGFNRARINLLSQAGTTGWSLYDYGDSSDTFSISTYGGSDRLTVLQAGNVTINAPTSGTALTVTGVAGNNGTIVVSAPTNAAQIRYTDATVSAYSGVGSFTTASFNFGTSSAHNSSWYTNGSQRVLVSSAGNVTINAPGSGNALTVTGISGTSTLNITGASVASISVTQTGVVPAVAAVTTGTSTISQTNGSGFYSATTDWVGSTGSNGLFLSSPYNTGTSMAGFLRLTRGTGNNYIGLDLATTTAHPIRFSTNASTENAGVAMTIASGGNVTIAAPTSGNALTIGTVGGATSPLVITGVASQTGANISTTTPSGTTNFWRLGQPGIINWDLQNVATTGEFRITNGTQIPFQSSGAGNVTINAPSSGYSLTVSGTANATFTDGTGNYGIQMTAGAAYVGTTSNHSTTLRTNNTDRVVMSNTGNVTVNAAVSGTTFNVVGTASGSRLAEFGGNLAIYESASRSYVADFDWSSTTFRIRPWTATGSTLELYTTPSGGSATSRVAINSTGTVTVNAPTSGVGLKVQAVSGTHSTQIADSANTLYDAGYLDVPQNSQTASYTLALTDRGKHISITTGGVVIPANSGTAFPVGSAVTIFNNSGSSQTISITTDTLRLAGTATTGSRTLAQYGTATVLKVSSTVWVISGAGLT